MNKSIVDQIRESLSNSPPRATMYYRGFSFVIESIEQKDRIVRLIDNKYKNNLRIRLLNRIKRT